MRPLFPGGAYTVVFTYCALSKWFVPVTLPALLAGVLGFGLMSQMPPENAIASAVILAGLVAGLPGGDGGRLRVCASAWKSWKMRWINCASMKRPAADSLKTETERAVDACTVVLRERVLLGA